MKGFDALNWLISGFRCYYCIPVVVFFAISYQQLHGQVDIEIQIRHIDDQIKKLDSAKLELEGEMEELKLAQIRQLLKEIGLPSGNYIEHSAMFLEYSEEHEQARWVTHMITPDIATGNIARTNDFREDPKVITGTAVEADYFLKYLQSDSTYEYDGFGYDRGHLAPSADFRWSEKALSESYFYSNMSPQLPEFNREAWADLENHIRSYVMENQTSVFVVTAPLLKEGLPFIEKSVNCVSIPEGFVKVVLDVKNERGIAFILPHGKIHYPLSNFSKTIDEAEKITGFDFFSALPDVKEDMLESRIRKEDWFPELAFGDVEPLPQPEMKPGFFNSVIGGQYLGKNEDIWVCGKVVSSRYSRSGHLWLNLDKNFPNQIFSIFIRKDDFVQFTYNPKLYFTDRNACFAGKVEDFNGTPTINVAHEEAATLLTEASN